MNWALALLSAVLLILVHPDPDIKWLAWLALTPLLYAIAREPRWKHRFLLGWTAGILYWFVHCNWIQFVLDVHGGMGHWGGWGTFFLFCFYKALHLGAFAALAGWLTGRWWSPPLVAALWVGIERTHGTFAFAWLTLGNAGIDFAPLVAPWVGVYGLSFLFALVAAGLASRKFYWCVPAVLLFVPVSSQRFPAQAVATVLQPNINEEIEWTADSADQLQLRLISQSLDTAVKSKSRLIIWPEAPAPLYLDDASFRERAAGLARTSQAWFLFGAVGYTPQHAPLNSAALISPAGEFTGHYDKMYLVPFGEFIPPLFSFVNKITKEAGNYEPGKNVVTFPVDGHRLGTFICYESAFPHLVRQFSAGGADVLINISNDGYFGRSYARKQHLDLVRMRAVENRRWIVRPTNDGISAVVDPVGRVTEQLEPFKELTAVMKFGYVSETTFYTRHGDWFAWSCLVLSLLTVARYALMPRSSL